MRIRAMALHYSGHLLLAVMLVVLLFPFAVMLGTSLKSFGEVYTSPPSLLPAKLMFSNYVNMFSDFQIGVYFRNSFVIAAGATLVTLVCTIPASYALGRLSFPGRRTMLFVMLGVIMFSPVVVVISLFQLMGRFNLLDSHLALMLVNGAFSLAFCTWMLTAYLHSIPQDMEEAAMLDGCSRFGAFVRVVLPLAAPGMATVIIFAFIQAWNEFLLANTLLISQNMKPLSVALYVFVGYHETKWQYLMAATVLATVPVVVLFLFIQRYLVQGLVGGALK